MRYTYAFVIELTYELTANEKGLGPWENAGYPAK
jgi:hypothetical protein